MLELQVVALGPAEPLVVVRERGPLARPDVAAPLVPGDQLLAERDHRHAHLAGAPLLLRQPFGLGEDLFAETAALAAGRSEERRGGKGCWARQGGWPRSSRKRQA